jgi:hypothetical protein
MSSQAPTLLVLQHIACEPPAAYEDELLAWDARLHRVALDGRCVVDLSELFSAFLPRKRRAGPPPPAPVGVPRLVTILA